MVAEDPDGALAGGKLNRGHVLSGYEVCKLRGVSIVVREGLADAFATVLEQHQTLYAWASAQAQPIALKGRAPVYVAPLPSEPSVDVVVRHAWHGGMFASITGDRFFRPSRAPAELLQSSQLRHFHIPTPELLAYALYNTGLPWVHVDVATRYVPNSYDLSVVLRGLAPAIERNGALDAVQALLVQLAAFGFMHRDLNVKNILLYHERKQLVAAVLDVDVVQWRNKLSPATTMRANTSRLARSMRKARRQFGVSMSDAELDAFVQRTLAATPPSALSPDQAHTK